MNRRSFFGFFPVAIAGVALGIPVVKTASSSVDWRSIKLYCDFASRSIAEQMRASREILDRAPAIESHIDTILRIDLERLQKFQAELAHYPARGIVT